MRTKREGILMKSQNNVTRKQLVDALCDILDGLYEYDVQYKTGLNLTRCKEIVEIRNKVNNEWLKKE